MFQIKGVTIKSKHDYLRFPRTKVTTTIRRDYYNEYKKLMDSIGVEYSKGFDMLIEQLSEHPDLLQEFIDKCKKY